MTSLLGLGSLVYILNKGSHFPVSQWLVDAFDGLAFTFGWVLGFSETTACMAAVVFLLAMLAVFFLLGYKIAAYIKGLCERC